MRARDSVTVKPGRNVWLLARTDRDAPTRAEVERSALAALCGWLLPASALGHRGCKQLGDTSGTIGSAAVQVSAVQGQIDRTSMPGELVARFEDCPSVRAVVAEQPWFVVADINWATDGRTIPWPRRGVNASGDLFDHDQQLDWLLVEARSAPAPSMGGSVGAVERSATLPVGDYWIDIFQKPGDFTDTRVAFRMWLVTHSATVLLTTSEDKGDHDWVLFHVSQPTDFPQADFGAPTIAGPDVHHSEDTVQRPPPPPSLQDQAGSALESVASGFHTFLIVAGVGVAGFVIYKLATATRGSAAA